MNQVVIPTARWRSPTETSDFVCPRFSFRKYLEAKMSRCSKSFLRVGGGGWEVVREQRVGGSSTRFPLSRWWGGVLVCPGVVTTSRDVDWSGRCARLESRRPKKRRSRRNTRRRPTRENTNQSKTTREEETRFRLFSLDWPSAFQFSVSLLLVKVSSFLCVSLINWRKSDLKSWRNHVECSSACLAHTHTHWRTHLVDYTH